MIRTLCVVAVMGLVGCDKKADADKADVAQAAVVRAPLVVGYEALRDRLADDDFAGAKTAAEGLSKVGLSAQADAVAKAADIEAARTAFGELSKAYLTQLVKEPVLAEGLHAFRCPMAEGYQKWVQTDEKLKNPYMGKRMLECGSKVDLVP